MPAKSRPPVIQRVIVPPAPLPANGNICRRYAIEHADWIWHPNLPAHGTAHVLFRRSFRLKRRTRLLLHSSADQRYELRIDGHLLSRGPHRSDLQHWSFESHAVVLAAGRHTVEATVWWLPAGTAPWAQVSWRGGFILAAEGEPAALLNTGAARWQVRRLDGITLRHGIPHSFHVVGPGYAFDGPAYHRPAAWHRPTVLAKPWHKSPDWYGNGTIQRDWALHPSPLPNFLSVRRQVGTVRAISQGAPASSPERFHALTPADQPLVARLESLLRRGTPLRVPAHTRLRVVIDLDDYYCGYPQLRLRGTGTVILEWAEALFHELTPYGKAVNKGQRDEVVGKFFHGFGDSFRHAGPARDYAPFWWRAGRYWQLTVETGAAPLVIERLDFEETRYPFDRRDRFTCDRPEWRTLQSILWRGIATSAHETFADSPYYEQMMYVADARIEALCQYVCTGDGALARRGLELFDWSRWRTGFVAERYPSDPIQLSLTFSTLWVGMLRDYAWWCDDPVFVRERLIGARSLLENFLPLRDERGLLARLPGWSYVDWTTSWKRGQPTGERDGGSASVNLQFLLMLQALVELEETFGEPALARRIGAIARSTAIAIRDAFWHEERGLLAEDIAHTAFSEHAQVLAVLAGILPPAQKHRALAGLLSAPDLTPCSIYFSHYWLEAVRRAGLGVGLVAKLDEWTQLIARGFKAGPEEMTVGRSDNHGWASHPLFHYHASLAGVRPATAGFKTVEVAPQPGPLKQIESRLPHPHGFIVTRLQFDGASCRGTVTLPRGLTGTFRWQGRSRQLRAGANRIG